MKVDVSCWFCGKKAKVSGDVPAYGALNEIGWAMFQLMTKKKMDIEGAVCKDCCDVLSKKAVARRGTIVSLGHSAGMYSGKETLGGEGIVIAKKK